MIYCLWTSLLRIATRLVLTKGNLSLWLLCLIFSRTLSQVPNNRTPWPSRNHPTSYPHMGPETLVGILQERGDPAAESNAHRLSLSLQTASRFITDVLERSIAQTLRSTVTARENLFYSLQSVKNDSARMIELVDSTSETVADAAKKSKQDMNDAIRTSLHHLAESIKIILRALPPSPLNEQRLLTIIDGAQYRMEIVVENAGQRVSQALHSYRGHLVKVDRDSGQLMVDGPSTQQATDVLKHVIEASQTQIEGAVLAGTSFVLARVRSYLAGEPLLDASTATLTPFPPTSSTTTFFPSTTALGSSTATEPLSTSLPNDHMMEDPQHEEVTMLLSTSVTELPMVINTSTAESEVDSLHDPLTAPALSSTTTTSANSTLDGIQIHDQEQVTVGVVDAVTSPTAATDNITSTIESSGLGPAFSWQDDLLMSFQGRNENGSVTTTSTPSTVDDDMAGWPAVRQATTKRLQLLTKDPKTLPSGGRTRRSTGPFSSMASPGSGEEKVRRSTRPGRATSLSTTQTLIRRRIPYHLRPIR